MYTFPSRHSLAAAAGVLLAAAHPSVPALAQGTSAMPVIPAGAARTGSHALEARMVARVGAITIDGRITEAAWLASEPLSSFTQTDPVEGQPATQRTEVRFVFDEDAVYVSARMFDSLGAAGVRTQLARRDQSSDGDYVQVIFDTFHDHLGQAVFQVNPSGVKVDRLGVGGTNLDSGWDPIWEVATSVDSAGWSAEMRIPLSQLRFSRESSQTWGLQVRRYVQRLNESSQWAFWTRTESGGPARFGHLDGLQVARMPRSVEVVPYVVGLSRHIRPAKANNPFNDGSEQGVRYGGDLKYRLTSNLTLDATVNPDFGQVEVDPAVVNLSAFETYFSEKRPFFVEGGGIFGFGAFSCYFCNNVSSMEGFYSRRIGRAPQLGGLARNAGEYSDVPDNSTILGAAKITGRTGNGYTIGLLNAVTREEHGDVVTADGRAFSRLVEPRSNYFVGRLKKDARGGNLVMGLLATSAIRDLSDTAAAARLNRHAEEFGADFRLRWGQQKYSWMGSFAYSNIAGSPSAILRAQHSSARYFQRPDREGSDNRLFTDRYDSSATGMQGAGAYMRVGKDVGPWMWETAVNTRSPGFEVNDLGFQSRADYFWQVANVARSWTRPTKYYRNIWSSVGAQYQRNWDGQLTDMDYHAYFETQTPQYLYFSTFTILWPELYDDRMLRGGPVTKRAGAGMWAMNFGSDSRKPVYVNVNPSFHWNDEGGSSQNYWLSVTAKPRSNVQLRMGPSFNRGRSTAHYVDAVADPTAASFYGTRYVLATLDQRSVSMDTRVNWTFTPTMSLELFAQPLIASGRFSEFKEFDAPGQLQKSVFGRDRGTVAEVRNEKGELTGYTIDADGTGASAPFTLDNPDFNFRSLRGNAVFRWEYRPGSTLFFVWTQSRANTAGVGDFDFTRDRTALLAARPDNIFLVKMSYWLGM